MKLISVFAVCLILLFAPRVNAEDGSKINEKVLDSFFDESDIAKLPVETYVEKYIGIIVNLDFDIIIRAVPNQKDFLTARKTLLIFILKKHRDVMTVSSDTWRTSVVVTYKPDTKTHRGVYLLLGKHEH